jgi:hypothetical protein
MVKNVNFGINIHDTCMSSIKIKILMFELLMYEAVLLYRIKVTVMLLHLLVDKASHVRYTTSMKLSSCAIYVPVTIPCRMSKFL